MAEPTQFIFKHQEVVEALIRKQGLHEGSWALTIQFGFAASNVGEKEGAVVNPAGILLVTGIGLQLVTEDVQTNNITVDAAKVNPPTGA